MATMMARSMNVFAVRALDVASSSSQLERRGLRLNVANHSSVVFRSSPRRSIVVVSSGEGVTDKIRSAAESAKKKLEHAAHGETESLESKGENALEEAGSTVETSSNALRKGVSKDMKGKVSWNRGQLAYVIAYVQDVNRAAEFYNKAFGLEIRPQNRSNSWVEMETGATTLAFTPVKQHETELTGGVSSSGNSNIVINLDFEDVEAAYKHAIEQGAKSVAEPEDKSWPQKVGYVKDMDGNIVRLGSFPDM
ncbi:hypothetical protein M758_11G115000 [Ceratodon purpureus]|nr:hypothetical protein M758_11G115000 [Ceratodon purpureus]